MSSENPTNRSVNCPVHGTHGNLSNGSCWYCVQSGLTATAGSPTARVLNPTVVPSAGAVRRIG